MPKVHPQYEPFPSWYADEDFVLMLDYGFDESGKGNRLIVSAQIGRSDRLRRFSRKWQSVLEKADIPYFHSKDFNNYSSGIFKSLDRSERLRLLRKLCILIHDFVDVGFSAKIDTSHYKAITTPEFRSRWGSAYSYAAQCVALNAYAHLRDKQLELDPVNVLFEWGHRNVGQAIDHFCSAIDGTVFINVKTCGKGPKEGNPLLQAADMLAFSVWQEEHSGDMTIRDELNHDGIPYSTYTFECDDSLINSSKRGVDMWTAWKKAFWESKRKR